MVAKLDESVGAVIAALQDTDLLRNSIIIFTTDNGLRVSTKMLNQIGYSEEYS